MRRRRILRRSNRRDLLLHERGLLERGILAIGGVDEVGRGCLAGPVFAAAVILPPAHVIPGIDDSKKLSPAVRERFFEIVLQEAVAWGVAMVDAAEIDRINIHHASLKAMRLAVLQLVPQPQFLLVDGRFPIPDCLIPQKTVVRGDQLSQTIAAASILAKVSRDRWIGEAGREYPGFDFKSHKGYGTARHLREIKREGLSPLHRRSFRREVVTTISGNPLPIPVKATLFIHSS